MNPYLAANEPIPRRLIHRRALRARRRPNPDLDPMTATCPNCRKKHQVIDRNAYCQDCSIRFRALGGYGFVDFETGEFKGKSPAKVSASTADTLFDYSTERLEQITGSLWQVATGIDDDKHNAAEESEAWRELDQLSADLCDAYRIIFALMQERERGNNQLTSP